MPTPEDGGDDSPSHRRRIVLLVGLMLAITTLHYAIPTATHAQHQLHIAARKLYFLPVGVAAAWFGLRGSIRATAVMSTMLALHALLRWSSDAMERANQLGEFVTLWIVGAVVGLLFDRERGLLDEIAKAHAAAVTGLVAALDLREHDTGKHSLRVRAYTLLLSRRLGLDAARREAVGLGALLHDVGKIAVPDGILLKSGPLTSAEQAVMREHPAAGYRILCRVGIPAEAAECVLTHHERYDGRGYPQGLSGDAIPVGARIFAVVDAYDALTSVRPYRGAVSHAEAVSTIRAGAGTQFDPRVVTAMMDLGEAAIRRTRRQAESELPT